ncbi:MAG: hypothetical protein AAGE90_18600 [Pseudomonadota bacterium]
MTLRRLAMPDGCGASDEAESVELRLRREICGMSDDGVGGRFGQIDRQTEAMRAGMIAAVSLAAHDSLTVEGEVSRLVRIEDWLAAMHRRAVALEDERP